jgi:hypothetical protein
MLILKMEKRVQQVVLSRLFGILFILILFVVGNALVPSINNNLYGKLVNFFDSNLIFILLMMFIGLLNEVFWSFYFPFNFIAPITTGAFGVYITMFIFKVWTFLDQYLLTGFVIPISTIYLVVFLTALIFGYLFILDRGGRPKEDWGQLWNWQKDVWKKTEGRVAKFDSAKGKKKGKAVGWHDVGDQFKLFFYNLGRSMNKSFEKKKRKR